MKNKLYIAYGSNLNKEQMKQRCPDAIVKGTTVILKYALLFRGNPERAVATIEPNNRLNVPAAVWSISDNDEKSLDIYEGFPHLYTKKYFDILLNGETVTAMAYVMTPGKYYGKPSKQYYGTIAKGYNDFDISQDVLKEATERSYVLYYGASETKLQKARSSISKYMKKQREEFVPVCPRCGRRTMKENFYSNALSRRSNIYICDKCGMEEAMKDVAGHADLITDWYAAKR